MQGPPNRLGLGLRPVIPSYGQGPPIGSLPPSNVMYGYPPPGAPPGQEKLTTLFVGGISAGVTDDFMNSLLSVSDANIYIYSSRPPVEISPPRLVVLSGFLSA